MIDNNVDRMSVNILPFSLDRTLSDVGGSVRGRIFNIFFNRINQDQSGHRVCSLRTDQPGFFCVNFQSQITGNEVF